MLKNILKYSLLCGLFTALPGCTAVNAIFKAGMVWGVIVVAAVIVMILFFISRSGK